MEWKKVSETDDRVVFDFLKERIDIARETLTHEFPAFARARLFTVETFY